ncbi:MAG TPA: M56 family metallopeptidase [Pirellulales bacterium]|nr:M56 family metallopeptidase [Pirellulales bacterium]
MIPFNHFLETWLAWLVASSWQLALLISVVAVLTRLLRAASPRLRHALWLLVLAKAFLPPGLTTPMSVGRWGVGPLSEALGLPARSAAVWPVGGGRPGSSLEAAHEDATERARREPSADRANLRLLLAFCVWSTGCLSFWGFVLGRYARLSRTLNSSPTLDEGPIRVALERAAIQLGLRRIPDVVAVDLMTSPFLFGLLRPRIVLPRGLLGRWSDAELRAVLVHELAHWQRGDTWIGWLQTTAHGLFWFHPFLWWAGGQVRHHRECACDETVLRLGEVDPQQYGEAILDMLSAMRGRSLASGSLVGIFEEGTQLQNRLEEIMNYHPTKRRFGSLSRLAIITTAVLLLPMSPGAGKRPAVLANDEADKAETAKANDPHARIVKSSPRQGATEVDPDIGEISVTFDRDMEPGMSWTGGPPLFPPLDKSRQPRWTDQRTCVLPVKLEAGAYYRLGINSSSHQNFRAKKGPPAATAALYFSTKGATEEVAGRVRVPAIVAIEPKNGAGDVDPETKSLRVTFNIPMSEGMSWTGDGESFPKIPEGKSASWSDDALTCTLPVKLEPDHDYELGLNSVAHNNFQSKWGVPLEAVVYKFHTRPAGR